MANEAVKFGFDQKVQTRPSPEKINGVSLATVINNVDPTGEARVQLILPWLPGVMPWARVASPMAGMLRGLFFMPQIGDEVLVCFNQGDIREPFIIGALWNTIDRPPTLLPTDAITQRKIRTPSGHELSFDETTQSVTLTSNMRARVTLDLLKAELSTDAASVTIKTKTADPDPLARDLLSAPDSPVLLTDIVLAGEPNQLVVISPRNELRVSLPLWAQSKGPHRTGVSEFFVSDPQRLTA